MHASINRLCAPFPNRKDTLLFAPPSSSVRLLRHLRRQFNARGAASAPFTVARTLSAPAGSGPLTFSFTGLPGGLSTYPGTGEITGTAAASGAALSPDAVTVAASNAVNLTSQPLTWDISGMLAMAAVSDPSDNEGESASPALAVGKSGDMQGFPGKPCMSLRQDVGNAAEPYWHRDFGAQLRHSR